MRTGSFLVAAVVASALALTAFPGRAPASILTFTSPTGLFAGNQTINLPKLNDPTLPIYGDHITGLTVGSLASPNAYSYGGSLADITPNIGVAYGPGNPASPASNPFPIPPNPIPVWWGSNIFGNLAAGVMYQVNFPNNLASLTLSVTFTADPGYQVDLRGFDLAAYFDPLYLNNLNLLQVIVDGTPTTLGTNIAVSRTTRNSYTFAPRTYAGSVVTIYMDGTDASGYANAGQAIQSFTDIAIDNIAFTQFTPEPTGIALIGLGAMVLIRRRRLATVAAICALSMMMTIASPRSASASVIQLSGGDPGEGYAPAANIKYAYHFNLPNQNDPEDVWYAQTYTVQGVPFAPFILASGNTTVGNANLQQGTAYPQGAPTIGDSGSNPGGNDWSLQRASIVDAFAPSHGPMTLTLSGLVTGKTYQLDLIYQPVGDQELTLTINPLGQNIVERVEKLNNGGKYWDVRNDVVAMAGGIIVVEVTNDVTDFINPYFNAFSVTFTPEPTSAAIATLFVGATLASRQRARQGR